MSKSEPVDIELYKRAKQIANEKFDAPTGAYKSMYIVKKYKELGGTYDKPKPRESKLTDWQKEHWIDLNQPKAGGGYEKCGHPNKQNDKYPLCRPSKKVNEHTPKLYQNISKNRIDEVNDEKQMVKNRGNIKF